MILCPKCKAVLFPIHISNWVTCGECFHRWELNEDNTAIKTVDVHIEKVTVKMDAKKLMNGVNHAIRK